jgi:hypothetical protein
VIVSSATLTTMMTDVPPSDIPESLAVAEKWLISMGVIAIIARYNAPNRVIFVSTF